MDPSNKSEIVVEIPFLPVGILVQDSIGKIQIVNNEFLRIFNLGVILEELIGTKLDTIINNISLFFKNATGLCYFFSECSSGKKENHSEFETLKNKKIRISYCPLILNNKPIKHIWIFYPIMSNDSTPDLNLQKMQIQLERAKALKELREEIKNHLSAIDSSISLWDILQSNFLNEESSNKYLKGLDEQITQLSEKFDELKKLAN